MPWRARGLVCLLRDQTRRRHPAGPAPPSRPAVRHPTRPARGVSGFWLRQIQKQLDVGTLVSNQERRAAVVPVLNRLLTAGQPVIVFLLRFTWGFSCSCFPRVVRDSRPRCSGGQDGRLSPGRTDRLASRTGWPCSARPPRRAPPRSDSSVVYSGFGFTK